MLKRFVYLILLCLSAGTLKAQTPQEQEANLKAVFIYNFINYIDWETGNDNNDFVIGIVGSSAVTKPLIEISQDKTAKNKKIIVKVFNSPQEISNCQILFIPQNLPFSLHSILEKTDKGILTISEEKGYAEQGTAFNFIMRDDKLKFEANLKAIDMAGLKASSQLLKLAKIVGQEK
jgi:YfiR/HmsC-like